MNGIFRAALFDLDGTLIDSLTDLTNATNTALAALDCATHPLADYRFKVGDGARTLCSRALPADKQHLIDQAVRLMRAHYETHCIDETQVYPGVAELVSVLHDRGLKLAVLSNKPDDFTKRLVDHYFPSKPFDLVCGQKANVPLKPDPTSALQIATELGVTPPQCLYLGDTNTDMRTARAAGMRAIGVLWGFRDREELTASGADAVIGRPEEVLELLPAKPRQQTSP